MQVGHPPKPILAAIVAVICTLIIIAPIVACILWALDKILFWIGVPSWIVWTFNGLIIVSNLQWLWDVVIHSSSWRRIMWTWKRRRHDFALRWVIRALVRMDKRNPKSSEKLLKQWEHNDGKDHPTILEIRRKFAIEQLIRETEG